MTITVDATYENGVLVPDQPLALGEHEKVRVTVELPAAAVSNPKRGASEPSAQGGLSALERIIARAEALPAEVVAAWPRDGASQHDHYIYGKA